MKPRLLDLFCGAGGAGKGYADAGFEVVGVDIEPQPNYPFEFIQDDAIRVLRMLIEDPDEALLKGYSKADFDAIHASPPCQAHTSMKAMWNAKQHEDLVGVTRALLEDTLRPYVIENVVGAPLINPVLLCGSSFGLGTGDAELRRHRLFETSFPVMAFPCSHGSRVIGVYGGHARNRARTIGVYGKGARDSRRKSDRGHPDFTADEAREAMGIDWMSISELSQAIPPAYTEHIGGYLMAEVTNRQTQAAISGSSNPSAGRRLEGRE